MDLRSILLGSTCRFLPTCCLLIPTICISDLSQRFLYFWLLKYESPEISGMYVEDNVEDFTKRAACTGIALHRFLSLFIPLYINMHGRWPKSLVIFLVPSYIWTTSGPLGTGLPYPERRLQYWLSDFILFSPACYCFIALCYHASCLKFCCINVSVLVLLQVKVLAFSYSQRVGSWIFS
jgi:hypothetical protein